MAITKKPVTVKKATKRYQRAVKDPAKNSAMSLAEKLKARNALTKALADSI